MRNVAWFTKVTAISSIVRGTLSCGTPLFSTERGHVARGSRHILKTLASVGAESLGSDGLKKRLPSKWSEIGQARFTPEPLESHFLAGDIEPSGMDPKWIDEIERNCRAASVAFFF